MTSGSLRGYFCNISTSDKTARKIIRVSYVNSNPGALAYIQFFSSPLNRMNEKVRSIIVVPDGCYLGTSIWQPSCQMAQCSFVKKIWMAFGNLAWNNLFFYVRRTPFPEISRAISQNNALFANCG